MNGLGDLEKPDKETIMSHHLVPLGASRGRNLTAIRFAFGLFACGLLSGSLLAIGGAMPAHAADTSKRTTAQKTFASPEQAADALAAAWHSGDMAALLEIFGPAGEKLVSSGDPVAEKDAHERLAASYDKGHRIETESDTKAVLILGGEEWPYPIPVVRQGSSWRFDVKAGEEQILDRRIGRNEMHAIEVCLTYVEAQRDYAAKDPLGNGLREYAQKVASTDGKHDGLFWRPAGSGEESPLGPLVAVAEAKGYKVASAEGQAPFQGYYYRILTAQGATAPGGAKNYIAGGHMTGGFALISFPAKYGDSGVMTFIVNQSGIVFEKNLGPDTASIASHMTEYNPDKSWKVVEQ